MVVSLQPVSIRRNLPPNSVLQTSMKFGEFLVSKEFITQESLNQALQIQQRLASETESNHKLLGNIIDEHCLAIDPNQSVKNFMKTLSSTLWVLIEKKV